MKKKLYVIIIFCKEFLINGDNFILFGCKGEFNFNGCIKLVSICIFDNYWNYVIILYCFF